MIDSTGYEVSRWGVGEFERTQTPPHTTSRAVRAEIVETYVDPLDTSDLPPVLAKLLAPWMVAIEASEIGMGDHVTAIAAHSFMSLLHRIELTPALERALVDAREATDTLATALDRKRAVPSRVRRAARHACEALIEVLRGAEPNAVTKELGLGW